ncbi:MAG TPA: glycosyltransferase family A protein, partial [Aggregatilineales bacterium]|nr:glycosyltransferase family A protein [Aggregatilineales bacterium]
MALQTLREQTLSREKFEVIIVDNVSTDDTKAVTESFYDMGNVSYVYEAKVGLSHARNTGIKVANGLYVVYTDDD